MREHPLVSVVAPVFNNGSHLRRCIESLLNQQGLVVAHQVILVDNGSTDDSLRIAENYPEITVLREPKRGAYPARNTGIAHAQAEIVAFTDGDCEADPNWLQAVLREMNDSSVAVAVGHCRYPSSASLALRFLGAYENAKADYVLTHCDRQYHFGYTNNMAVRTSIFEELGPFREWKRAGDTELIHRIAANKPEMRVVFSHAMRVKHLEFTQGMPRVSRLRTYTRTNGRIETFRELGVRQRLGVLGRLLRLN